MPGNENLLKHLGLTTDAELIAVFTNLGAKIKALSSQQQQQMSGDLVAELLSTQWQQYLQSKKLSNAALQEMLDNVNEMQQLALSQRLIKSGRLTGEGRFGDSFLLPDGLYQILAVKPFFLYGKDKPQLVKILSYAELKQANLEDLVPKEDAPQQTIDYGDKDYHRVNSLNQLIAQKKKGLWIGSEIGIAGACITSNYAALNNALTNELATRLPQKPLPTYQLPVRVSKTPQTEDARSLEAITTTMQEIAQQLNVRVPPPAGLAYQHRVADDNKTVEIYQPHPNNPSVVMAATSETVTLYQPFLREKKLSYAEKAALCLEALGIPPLNGRDSIEIEGASPKFRRAILHCFKKLIAAEQSNSLSQKLGS